MSRYSAKIFLSCIRFQYTYCIFISRQNKLISRNGLVKKIARFVSLRLHLLEIRWLRSWNTVAEPKIWHFFLLVVFPHNICLYL